MRFAVTVVLWPTTTAAVAVAIPAVWVQLHVIDADGYVAMAQHAAADPALQSAVAAELTTRAMALANERAAHGGGRNPVDGSQVHDAASAFTAGPPFPPLFAQANRAAHGWLFDNPAQDGNQWMVDVAPMLNDWFWWPTQIRTRPANMMLRPYGPRSAVRAYMLPREDGSPDTDRFRAPSPHY